jgi:DNA-binding GntR family transcriptional regulator
MDTKKSNLKQTAYEYIKQQIIEGDLLPGQDLDEEALRKEIGTSRTPVREAIMRLQSENLIEIYPRKGTFVANITVKMVNNIYQIREIIEPQAIAIAAPSLSKNILSEFIQKFKESPTGQKPEKIQKYYTTLDRDLHSYIISSCNNEHLISIMSNILNQSQRIRIQSFNIGDRYVKSNQEHISLLEVLLDGNVKKAMSLMQMHIANSKNVALNIINKND